MENKTKKQVTLHLKLVPFNRMTVVPGYCEFYNLYFVYSHASVSIYLLAHINPLRCILVFAIRF